MSGSSRVLKTVTSFSGLIDRCFSLPNPLSSLKSVQAQLIKLGFNSNTFLANRLVDLYFRSGIGNDALEAFQDVSNKNVVSWNLYLKVFVKFFGVDRARQVFDGMAERDAVSWNTLISGYIAIGRFDDGWRLFLGMQECGVKWSYHSLSIMLPCVKCCNHAKEMHCYIVRNGGCYSNLVVGNSLIDVYGKIGLVDYALAVFLSMEKVDVISWNSLIFGCCKSGHEVFALHNFCLMGIRGFKVDEYTLSALLTAASNVRKLVRGKQMFCLCVKLGFLSNTIVCSAAIDMFSKCNRMESAACVFRESDIVDAATCNSMIACYARHSLEENSMELFVYSFSENVRPTEFTLSCVIHSAAVFVPTEQGSQLHCLVIKIGLESDVIVASSLAEMYGKYALIGAALTIFEEMVCRDLIAWNTILLALIHNGKLVEALLLFKELLRSGLYPDHITFTGILLACRYGMFLEEGMAIFASMQKQYGNNLMSEHYAYIVDMNFRAGKIDEAIDLLHTMHCEPNALMCESILHACRDYGNLELIERVSDRMMELEPHASLPYLVLAHTYEQRGRWESLVRVRKKMRKMVRREIVDCSWISIKGHIFSFEANEIIHYGGKNIFLIQGLLLQKTRDEHDTDFY